MTPDITIRFAFDSKDNKWRWLVEVGEHPRAGEERSLAGARHMADEAIRSAVTTFYPWMLS